MDKGKKVFLPVLMMLGVPNLLFRKGLRLFEKITQVFPNRKEAQRNFFSLQP